METIKFIAIIASCVFPIIALTYISTEIKCAVKRDFSVPSDGLAWAITIVLLVVAYVGLIVLSSEFIKHYL